MKRLAILLLCLGLGARFAAAAELTIIPQDQARIVIDLISDTHCPFCQPGPERCPEPPCPDSIPCCDTFRAIAAAQATRFPAADFVFLNGDQSVNSKSLQEPGAYEHFALYYEQLTGARAMGVGNHEADGSDGWWVDPENHYAPFNWMEPLYGCDSLTALEDCPRWYTVYLGDPPRVAWLSLSNNSDERVGDVGSYSDCTTPNDGLNHAASPQRQWLAGEIAGLPASVEVVFIAAHRAYYGVENFVGRGNVEFSGTWFSGEPAEPETLRTGAVSLLRELESIPARTFVISGDQHSFAETVPILENARDDAYGVIYLTAGISGGWIGRGDPFPDTSMVPPGALVHAFNDRWGSLRFEVLADRVVMEVREAYTDSLLYGQWWPINPGLVTAPPASDPPGAYTLTAHPNPSAAGAVSVRLAGPRVTGREEIRFYDVRGRRVRGVAGPGVYFAQARRGGQILATTRIVIR